MQVKKWILVSGVMAAAIGISCNEAGSNKDNPDSTSVSTTTESRRTTRTVDVPEATRTSFEAKYPQAADVTWNYHEPVVVAPIEWEWTSWPMIDTNDYVATFKVDDVDYWVWYDDDGNWIGTVSEMPDHSSLPAAVNNVIKTQYAGYTITSVDKENDKNRTAYEVELEKGEDKAKLLVSESGQILKKKGTVNGEKVKEKSTPEK